VSSDRNENLQRWHHRGSHVMSTVVVRVRAGAVVVIGVRAESYDSVTAVNLTSADRVSSLR
jgi:hypothetical protein